MCRNIKSLFNFEPPVTDEEIRAASLQFVRKISGFTKPSKANEAAFHAAVEKVARVSSLRRHRATAKRRRRRPRRARHSGSERNDGSIAPEGFETGPAFAGPSCQ